MQVVSEDRLYYLLRQVAQMRLTGINKRELADIALETLVMRLELQRLTKEKMSKKQKKMLKANLKHLEELEKNIVFLYFMEKLKGERWADSSVFNTFLRRMHRKGME